MFKIKLRVIALLLVCTMLFSACDSGGYNDGKYDKVLGHAIISYEDMEYVRPDMNNIQVLFNNACDAANRSSRFSEVEIAVSDFLAAYNNFYTNYSIAYIEYCCDLTDAYWEEEYNFCETNTVTMDSYLEKLYHTLANCQFREQLESEDHFGADFFDPYEGEVMRDEGYIALAEQETQLLEKYYDIVEQSNTVAYYSEEYFSTYGTQLLQVYVDLVKLRQEIAQYAGYDTYAEYAYENTYYRDYTPEQSTLYLTEIGEKFNDDYVNVCQANVWALVSSTCYDTDTLAYLKETTDAMGETFQSGYRVLTEGKLYNITYDEKKYDVSYETYLWDYTQPYIFMSPYMNQADKLTFAHEFGHFLNDYVCNGSYAGTDVAEVHSQAFEYLSLCYASETENLTKYKMANSLCTYVETGAYALFEHKVFELSEEELTVENVQAIYEEIGNTFGFDERQWDSRDIICVPHIFIYPMYMVSYVVSNDLAMQFYQLELEETGKGLELYEDCLYSHDTYLIEFAKLYGLESPFTEGRLDEVEDTFENILD